MTRETFGKYTAVKGKLSPQDSREAYVTGPTLHGRIAPLASFWYFADACAWARRQHAKTQEPVACAQCDDAPATGTWRVEDDCRHAHELPMCTGCARSSCAQPRDEQARAAVADVPVDDQWWD